MEARDVGVSGYSASDNAMNFRAIRLHYSCLDDRNPFHPDPLVAARGQEWLDNQKRQWPDPNDFAREFEISFFSGQGARVFPQFTVALHTAPLIFNPRRIVYRGWDFGWHAPVCLFAQVDAKDRLVILHEIVGSQQTTQHFAGKVIQRSNEWFPNHPGGFEDFCDPAGQQVRAMENERNEKRDTEVLQGLGIYPKYQWGWSRKDGRSLVHQLLNIRSDGTPSLYVDEAACSLLCQSFLGRYVYPEKQDGSHDDEPDDRTHPWADVQAALRYLVIGLHPKLGVARFAMARSSRFVNMEPRANATHGYGTPIR